MEIKKRLIFILLILLANPLFAQSNVTPNCTVNPLQVSLTSAMVDAFFEKKSGFIILPHTQKYCFKAGHRLLMKDEFGQSIGQLTVKQVWQGPYSQYDIINLPEKSLPKQYVEQLKTMQLQESTATDYMIQSMYKENFNLYNENYLGLFSAEYNLDPSYKIKINKFSYIKKHPNAKNINYEQFLKFYEEGNYAIINVPPYLGVPIKYHVPDVKLHYQSNPSSFNKIYPLSIACAQIGANNYPEEILKKNIIVVSYTDTSNSAYNLIDELTHKGVTKIFWFNDFYQQWYKKTPAKNVEIPDKIKIKSAALIPMIKANKVTLVDIRSSGFHQNSIPGSKWMPVSIHDSKQYIPILKAIPPAIRPRTIESIKPVGIYYHMVYQKLDESKPIVLISDNMEVLSKELMGAYEILSKNWNFKNVLILDGGLASYYNETKWNHPEISPTLFKVN